MEACYISVMEPKKLYKSRTDRVFSGVLGGLGDYLGIDSTVLRLLWALLVVLTGFIPGVLLYIIALFIIPEAPDSKKA
jgi:phage shock protein C